MTKKSAVRIETIGNRRNSQEGFLGDFVVAIMGMCEGVLSLNSRERNRGYNQDNGAGLRRTKARRMPGPCSRGRTRNATLVRYGLSFVIPLSGDCDTEDTTTSYPWPRGGRGRLNIICISSATRPRPRPTFAVFANSRPG